MAATKSLPFLSSQATLVLVVIALVVQAEVGQAQVQTCSDQLGNLNMCAPFLLPGSANPNADCCSALQAIGHDCYCSTLRVAAQLPTKCSLPALSCGGN